MNQKEAERKQRELIKAFDKELFSYTGQGAWFSSGIFSFMILVFAIIPAQEYLEEGWGFLNGPFISMIWIPYAVLLPYLDTTDAFTRRKGKATTFSKLQYLPVSKKQYNRVRLEYLLRYLSKLTVIGLVLQCIASLVAYGSIGLITIVYPIVLLLVCPLFFGWILIVISW